MLGLDLFGSAYGPVMVFFEHSDESSTSVKRGQFIDKLREFYALKRESTPWSSVVSLRIEISKSHQTPRGCI